MLGLWGWGCQKERDWELQGLYQRGSLALGEGDLKGAESFFRRYLSHKPDHVTANNKLAQVLLRLAEQDPDRRSALKSEAVMLLQRSTRLEPGGKLAWKQLAGAYRQMGRGPEAMKAYRRLLELDQGDFSSRVALAELHEEAGAFEKARAVYEQGLATHSGSGTLLLACGRFLVRRKKDDEAEKLFRAVPQGSAEYYEALDELGGLLARRGALDEVRRVYEKLVEMNPQDYLAWELLAALDERANDFAAAEDKYRKSLEVDRLHISAWLGLARSLRAQERRREALDALRRADGFVARNPDKAPELADQLLVLDERAWALSVLERALIAAKDQELLSAIRERAEKLRAEKTPPGQKK